MMLPVLVYLGVGAVLVLQAVVRRWRDVRRRGLEGALLMLGAVVVWPVVLLVELTQYADAQRQERRFQQACREARENEQRRRDGDA